MVEVSLIELPSWHCLQINVTRTLLKINPTFVQVHLMTWCAGILLCDQTVVADPSADPSVSNQSAISWGAISNWLVIGQRLVGDCILSICFWLQKVCNFLPEASFGLRVLSLPWTSLSFLIPKLFVCIVVVCIETVKQFLVCFNDVQGLFHSLYTSAHGECTANVEWGLYRCS